MVRRRTADPVDRFGLIVGAVFGEVSGETEAGPSVVGGRLPCKPLSVGAQSEPVEKEWSMADGSWGFAGDDRLRALVVAQILRPTVDHG